MIIECITRSLELSLLCGLCWRNCTTASTTTIIIIILIVRQIKQQMQLSTDYLCDTMRVEQNKKVVCGVSRVRELTKL